MRLFLYSVFDSCAKVYDRPFCAQSDGAALRSFGDIANDDSHPIGQHPEHYALYRVGEWDDNTSKIIPEDACCLGRAHELLEADGGKSFGNLNSNGSD